MFDQLEQPKPPESFKSLDEWIKNKSPAILKPEELRQSIIRWQIELNDLDFSKITVEEAREGLKLIEKLLTLLGSDRLKEVPGLIDTYHYLCDLAMCPTCPFRTKSFLIS